MHSGAPYFNQAKRPSFRTVVKHDVREVASIRETWNRLVSAEMLDGPSWERSAGSIVEQEMQECGRNAGVGGDGFRPC